MTAGLQPKVAGRSWLRFLIGFALLWGVLAGLGEIDATGRWGLAIFAAVAAAAVIVEVIVYKTSVRAAVRHLGLGRPNARAVAVAAAVSVLILLVYPLTTAVTGAADPAGVELAVDPAGDLRLPRTGRGDRLARLRLPPAQRRPTVPDRRPLDHAADRRRPHSRRRQQRRRSWRSARCSSPPSPRFPFSYLYVTGRCTIWAPALVHTAIDTFKLVVIPTAAVTTFSLLLIAVSIVVPLLALAVPRRLLKNSAAPIPEMETVQ